MVGVEERNFMDSRLTHLKATCRSDGFQSDAALYARAHEFQPSEEPRDRRRPIAAVAGALHIHRPSLRFLRG
jgi:hypothetical protein